MRLNWKDPIQASALYGILCFGFSILALSSLKPDFVVEKTATGSRKILWPKLVILSLIIGIVISIVLFLLLAEDENMASKPIHISRTANY